MKRDEYDAETLARLIQDQLKRAQTFPRIDKILTFTEAHVGYPTKHGLVVLFIDGSEFRVSIEQSHLPTH